MKLSWKTFHCFEMKKEKNNIFKFWSISLDNFIKFKHFISEECMHFDWFIVTFIVFGDAYIICYIEHIGKYFFN